MNINIIFFFIILALGGWGYYEHDKFLSVKAEYSDFREQSVTQALAQEKQHNEQINVAMVERDAANKRLSDDQARSRALRTAITPTGPEKLCYSRSAFDAAISAYLAGIENLLADGDQAVIDNKAWLESWPK